MSHANVLMKTYRVRSEASRNLDFTPRAGLAENHVAVDLEMPSVRLMLEFSRNEVMEMISTFHDYIPTADAVHRFMQSNPKISALMLDELKRRLPPAEKESGT